jgi:hypothetical protein
MWLNRHGFSLLIICGRPKLQWGSVLLIDSWNVLVFAININKMAWANRVPFSMKKAHQ